MHEIGAVKALLGKQHSLFLSARATLRLQEFAASLDQKFAYFHQVEIYHTPS